VRCERSLVVYFVALNLRLNQFRYKCLTRINYLWIINRSVLAINLLTPSVKLTRLTNSVVFLVNLSANIPAIRILVLFICRKLEIMVSVPI